MSFYHYLQPVISICDPCVTLDPSLPNWWFGCPLYPVDTNVFFLAADNGEHWLCVILKMTARSDEDTAKDVSVTRPITTHSSPFSLSP